MNKMLILAIAFINGNINDVTVFVVAVTYIAALWLNLQILLVLLLIQFINLLRVVENKNTVLSQDTDQILAGILKM